jgi:hypothetical protein
MSQVLVVGVFQGYDYHKLLPWINSLNRSGFSGDKVLIGIDISGELEKKVIGSGVFIYKVNNLNDGRLPHIQRFKHLELFLEKNLNNYKYVIATDVADVVFQKDPSEWLIKNIGKNKIVSSGESILIKNEKWNLDSILLSYGLDTLCSVKDFEVQNVGIIAGKIKGVKNIAKSLYNKSLGMNFPTPDQPVYNVLIREKLSKNTLFTSSNSGWSINCATVACPTRSYLFDPYLINDKPYMDKDDIVKTSDGEIVTIVHQYNRNFEWNERILNKYGKS